MVMWHGVLTTAHGKREEYLEEIKKAGLVEKFLGHPGNVFYNIASSAADPDQVVVVDCWEDRAAFTAHDTSPDVDIWRGIYAKYVTGCSSELYECSRLD